MKIQQYWATPIICFFTNDVAKSCSEYALKLQKANPKRPGYYYSSNSWQSSDVKNDPILQEFLLYDVLNQINKCQSIEWKFKNAWINILPTGAYIKEHVHLHCEMSGVVHFQGSAQSGKLRCKDPRVRYEMIFQDEDAEFDPIPNQVVVFPAWLKHEVDMNQTPEPRISLAFDLIRADTKPTTIFKL